MDVPLPLSLQPPPVASGGATPNSMGKVPKRKIAKPKSRATPGTPNVEFEVCTPEIIRQQLELKKKRKEQYENVLGETPHDFKRNLDLTDSLSGQDSSKRAKTINGASEAGVTHTASGGNALPAGPKFVKPNKGGRPRKHPYPVLKPAKFFRTNKPIALELPADIWTRIFDFCPPDFLLQIRQINSLLRMLLDKQSQWKKARLHTYGFDHPDPPPGLTEMQYADLLTGVGCQGCHKSFTRKVYWAFQRRWCLKCVDLDTAKEAEILELPGYPWLRNCIPKITFDSWNRYSWAGDPSERPDWAQNAGTHTCYSRLAVGRLIRDFEEFLDVGPNGIVKTTAERDAWVNNRTRANQVLVERLRLIEAYVETQKKLKKDQAAATRATRVAFFTEQARRLDPPLSSDILDMIPKYNDSINIAKVPTERSWLELLPKLLEARAEAEERIRTHDEDSVDNEPKRTEYKAMLESRKQNTTAEQRFVLDLAEDVVNVVDASVEAGSVAAVDFVPLVFKRIFDAYDGIHHTNKPGDYEGRPYRLVLDDARMIYNCLIASAIDRWDDPAEAKAAKHLKCSGCKRKDSHRLLEFEDLINHIGLKHTKEVGPLSYFLPRLSTTTEPYPGIPWCLLEWPRNLPILASHRQVEGEWDPEHRSEYVHAPRVIPRNLSHGAFEGRSVENGNNPPRGDFIKNAVHVASLLESMPISTEFKTQIAFKYALERCSNASREFGADPTVPIQVLKDLQSALLSAGVRDVFKDLHCQACRANDAREKRHNKFADKKHCLAELIKHYLDTHMHLSWTSSLFVMPSAEELWEALTEPGKEPARQLFIKLFPETEKVSDPAPESTKVASLGPSLDQNIRPAMGFADEQAAAQANSVFTS